MLGAQRAGKGGAGWVGRSWLLGPAAWQKVGDAGRGGRGAGAACITALNNTPFPPPLRTCHTSVWPGPVTSDEAVVPKRGRMNWWIASSEQLQRRGRHAPSMLESQ